ncbi:hypothetical protein Ato02nite_043470 [Paractinoplanes toevensis]|uniref:Uncharacterized protein n=1 Tax=Paractinoplanes toevensis TaxID=571911 RepID=A0A919W399_9ACTN|nr:hypothetical protein Ato02nite_043470 [Actinoplanes toevensis]
MIAEPKFRCAGRHTPGIWTVLAQNAAVCEASDMTAAVDRRFVARRHVDYGRVRSAMCPAY